MNSSKPFKTLSENDVVFQAHTAIASLCGGYSTRAEQNLRQSLDALMMIEFSKASENENLSPVTEVNNAFEFIDGIQKRLKCLKKASSCVTSLTDEMFGKVVSQNKCKGSFRLSNTRETRDTVRSIILSLAQDTALERIGQVLDGVSASAIPPELRIATIECLIGRTATR